MLPTWAARTGYPSAFALPAALLPAWFDLWRSRARRPSLDERVESGTEHHDQARTWVAEAPAERGARLWREAPVVRSTNPIRQKPLRPKNFAP
jgi:hypothetical protein